MIDVESRKMGLHGEFETVLAVFNRGDESQVVFGGNLGGDTLVKLVVGVASVIQRMAEELGVSVGEVLAMIASVVGAGIERFAEVEAVRDDFADRDEIAGLAKELGVEMPA